MLWAIKLFIVVLSEVEQYANFHINYSVDLCRFQTSFISKTFQWCLLTGIWTMGIWSIESSALRAHGQRNFSFINRWQTVLQCSWPVSWIALCWAICTSRHDKNDRLKCLVEPQSVLASCFDVSRNVLIASWVNPSVPTQDWWTGFRLLNRSRPSMGQDDSLIYRLKRRVTPPTPWGLTPWMCTPSCIQRWPIHSNW